MGAYPEEAEEARMRSDGRGGIGTQQRGATHTGDTMTTLTLPPPTIVGGSSGIVQFGARDTVCVRGGDMLC